MKKSPSNPAGVRKQPSKSNPSQTRLVKLLAIGNTVRVQFNQKFFQGVVIAHKGKGVGRTFTVRKIASQEVGVERIFPLHSPLLEQVEVLREAKVRRAKLYYLRSRIGRAAMRVRTRRKT